MDRGRAICLRACLRKCLLMVLSVVFRRLMPVMGRMQSMRVRDMGVMASFLVIARLVVLGRFAMMARRGLMMFGCDFMVTAALVGLRAHVDLLSLKSIDQAQTATGI